MQYLDIGFWDILDIFLVGILIFQLYKLLKGSLAFNIFIGLLLVYLVSTIVTELNMSMLGNILGQFVQEGFILLVIVFQQEIRRFLFYIGRGSGIGKDNFFKQLFRRSSYQNSNKDLIKEELIRAINIMAKDKTGGLIVFVDSSEKRFLASRKISYYR